MERREGLRLGGGKPVLVASRAPDIPFRLTCEVAILEREGFAGCVFGAESPQNYATVYLYPEAGSSGMIQYDCSMNSSMTWQLFHGPGYQQQAEVPVQTWIRLRVDVYASHAEVFAGETDRPQLTIRPLLNGFNGRVGVWGYLPTCVKHLSVEPIDHEAGSGAAPAPEAALPPDVITRWEVAPAGAEEMAGAADDRLPWQPARTEENGVLNISRLFPASTGSVLVRTTVDAPAERTATLRFGFSDRLVLAVNGEKVYKGSCLWALPASDGRIRPDFANVNVRLVPGGEHHQRPVVRRGSRFRLGPDVGGGVEMGIHSRPSRRAHLLFGGRGRAYSEAI